MTDTPRSSSSPASSDAETRVRPIREIWICPKCDFVGGDRKDIMGKQPLCGPCRRDEVGRVEMIAATLDPTPVSRGTRALAEEWIGCPECDEGNPPSIFHSSNCPQHLPTPEADHA